MTLTELLKSNLAINAIWIDPSQVIEHRHLFWLESKKKKYKKIRYKTQHGMKEVLLPKHVKLHETLALYIKELYGDGFFYAPIIDGDVINYYLICIKDDSVISPIDTIISESMLNYILSHKESSVYRSLDVTVITDEIFSTIYEEYLNQERKYKNKLMKLSLAIAFGIVLFFIVIYILSLY
ncbi:hypothetical protein [Providencia rettgeri]|uniref:hypothetical protein n=1 Tax=Providencia rettgeri TaxID=587 RepID=UPI0034E0CDAA